MAGFGSAGFGSPFTPGGASPSLGSLASSIALPSLSDLAGGGFGMFGHGGFGHGPFGHLLAQLLAQQQPQGGADASVVAASAPPMAGGQGDGQGNGLFGTTGTLFDPQGQAVPEFNAYQSILAGGGAGSLGQDNPPVSGTNIVSNTLSPAAMFF